MTDREQLDDANDTIKELREQVYVLTNLVVELRGSILIMQDKQDQMLEGLRHMRDLLLHKNT